MNNSFYSRAHPFPATVRVNRLLTRWGSAKETRHYELSLSSSGLEYQVGDSLGIFPENNPNLVDQILDHLHFSGTEPVLDPAGKEILLREALLKKYALTSPPQALKTLLATVLERLHQRIEDQESWLVGRDVLDILQTFPAVRFSPEDLVAQLRKLQPRLYSIASSQKQVGAEVHLTVRSLRYEMHQRQREGVASVFLADRSTGEGRVPVFIHRAKHFHAPEDPSAHRICIGPGTGIAPFRAMLQERKMQGGSGKFWLFFGEQCAATDFLYQEELQEYQQEGVLDRLDTAFSRDQEHKIYVQHRLKAQALEIFRWLEEGAYVYVCGDATRMAQDVDRVLHDIVQEVGGKSRDDACAYMAHLKEVKRYRKDVY